MIDETGANAGVLRPSAAGAFIIDGKVAAGEVIARVTVGTVELMRRGPRPGLAVVLVGEDPASQIYVRSKGRMAEACGFHSVQHDLPAATGEAELLALIDRLNEDPAIHGILVQLPLPAGINATHVIERLSPAKDVDGLHPLNAGLLALGDRAQAIVPCTPAGALILIHHAAAGLGLTLAGREAVVIGRSNLVGKPIAQLLLAENMTVTMAHSRTTDLEDCAGRADVLVVAVGRPGLVDGSWVKRGAIVIDVGTNRIAIPAADGLPARNRLVGDVGFAEALGRAAAITPVPGGVGPMTIAMLMSNTLDAARRAVAHLV